MLGRIISENFGSPMYAGNMRRKARDLQDFQTSSCLDLQQKWKFRLGTGKSFESLEFGETSIAEYRRASGEFVAQKRRRESPERE